MAGAPPPGIDFLDDMYSRGVIATAESSFPRMGNAAGGMQGSPTLGEWKLDARRAHARRTSHSYSRVHAHSCAILSISPSVDDDNLCSTTLAP